MKAYWAKLSQRERLVVTVGGALVALMAFFQFAVSPLMDWRGSRDRELSQARNVYRLAVQASASSGVAETASADVSTPVRNAVSDVALRYSITLDFVNVRPDGAVEANVGSAATDALFSWFSELETKFGVTLVSADIAREGDEGATARAQLVFARPGA